MKIVYVCNEHLDEAMDDIINMNETFPVMDEELEEKCSYCNSKSKYRLSYNNN